MNFELDPDLQQKAEMLLETKADLFGRAYLKSRAKRKLDVVVSGASSLAVLPVVSLAGAAVVIADGGSPLVDVGHDCLGQREKRRFWKIRTMIKDAKFQEEEVTKGRSVRQMKREGNDPRITKVGRPLRRWNVDELPQLFNVFCGDLSMVGPRLLPRGEWRSILKRTSELPFRKYIDLLKDKRIKLGATSLYAIFGRENLSLTDHLWLDVLYGERASFKSDLRIMALTLPVLVKKGTGG